LAENTTKEMEEEIIEETVEETVTETEEAVETEADSEATDTEETASEEKKGFFKKKDKKDKKDLQIEELTDKYKRTMAEFDNYRKRTEKEKTAMYEIGAREVINKILPIVDNFERGLALIPEADRTTPVADGMDKIYKQLTKTLEHMGVKEIEALGVEFNPDFHNAVMHCEDDSLGENIIAEVLQKGYTYKESVVRHSMVKVAN
jgi:molecular chaperone GrpE